MKASEINNKDTKWVFIKKGTCSRTLFYILNREFGNPLEDEECAADPLAGGIVNHGYQCGMIWGASMGLGAESFRRCDTPEQATGLAINATRQMNASFAARAETHDCEDITGTDLTSKASSLKLLVSGKFVKCFRLADKWAPEALKTALEALAVDKESLPQEAISCASEVVRKMGGSKEEMAIVAGFAGGLGLSGNGCGALSAAIWRNTLTYCRNNPGKNPSPYIDANNTLEIFFKETDYEFECHKICGTRFETTEEHTAFIQNGGCSKLIDALAVSGRK